MEKLESTKSSERNYPRISMEQFISERDKTNEKA
jgi:hypothetical protein